MKNKIKFLFSNLRFICDVFPNIHLHLFSLTLFKHMLRTGFGGIRRQGQKKSVMWSPDVEDNSKPLPGVFDFP
jgi:hypothetical protein